MKQKFNILRLARRLFVRRKYKDFLFRRVFEDKSDLLELYNALNNTHYNNPDELEITTLEDVIYMSMKNDLSFIISSTLNLYEHQSTFNPNMPLRGLFYFSKMYEAYIKINELDIYGKSLVSIPKPQYVVFYNGREAQPDEQILKLSDAFISHEENEEAVVEIRARMLNINYGHNERLLNTCKRLHDYSFFVSEVNNNLDKGFSLNEAVNVAMKYCIEKDVLSDILTKHQSEVFQMLLTEYDEKLHLRTVREEGRAEGHAEGRAEGRKESLEALVMILRPMMNDNFDDVCKEIRKSELFAKYTDEDIRKYWK